MIYYRPAQNRLLASLADPYPVFTPSPEAVVEIETLAALHQVDFPERFGLLAGTTFYENMYSTLIEDQARNGLRVHKGHPLYWLAQQAGVANKEKALQLMLEAFVEDVLTHGHRAFQGFASTSLKDDFGITSDVLGEFKEFVTEKTKPTFFPSAIVAEFFAVSTRRLRAKDSFKGVTEDSKLESIVTQIRERLRADLRPSFKGAPSSEAEVQNVVQALLRQIDSSLERERSGTKFAGREFKIDFSLFHDVVGVEVKLIREKAGLGNVTEEISADINPYLSRFKRLVFVVYDACGAINDSNKFVADIKGNRKEIEVVLI